MARTTSSRSYHHGALREALLDTVDETVRESGIESVTIRGCAQRIGVSHSAAFRHFASKQELLTAFAARSAREMAAYLDAEAAKASDPRERLLLTGVGYIRFAMERPGAFRMVFREELIDADDAEYRSAMQALEARLSSGVNVAKREGFIDSAALLAWAATHGLAALYVDGSLSRDLPPDKPLEAMRECLALLGKVFRSDPNA